MYTEVKTILTYKIEITDDGLKPVSVDAEIDGGDLSEAIGERMVVLAAAQSAKAFVTSVHDKYPAIAEQVVIRLAEEFGLAVVIKEED